MSTCRCGASAWHPEARTCTLTHCELRARIHDLPRFDRASDPLGRPAAGFSLTSRDPAASPTPLRAGGPFQQRAGNREPESLRGEVESAGVHEEAIMYVAA